MFLMFWPILGNVWCSVVTLISFSSNLNNFKKKKIYIKSKDLCVFLLKIKAFLLVLQFEEISIGSHTYERAE